jgi:hypothetical protein
MDKQQNIEARPGDAERPQKRNSDERVDCAHVSGLAGAAR